MAATPASQDSQDAQRLRELLRGQETVFLGSAPGISTVDLESIVGELGSVVELDDGCIRITPAGAVPTPEVEVQDAAGPQPQGQLSAQLLPVVKGSQRSIEMDFEMSPETRTTRYMRGEAHAYPQVGAASAVLHLRSPRYTPHGRQITIEVSHLSWRMDAPPNAGGWWVEEVSVLLSPRPSRQWSYHILKVEPACGTLPLGRTDYSHSLTHSSGLQVGLGAGAGYIGGNVAAEFSTSSQVSQTFSASSLVAQAEEPASARLGWKLRAWQAEDGVLYPVGRAPGSSSQLPVRSHHTASDGTPGLTLASNQLPLSATWQMKSKCHEPTEEAAWTAQLRVLVRHWAFEAKMFVGPAATLGASELLAKKEHLP